MIGGLVGPAHGQADPRTRTSSERGQESGLEITVTVAP